MTNEIRTTLDDIQAKAERKREVLDALERLLNGIKPLLKQESVKAETIRKYIKEN